MANSIVASLVAATLALGCSSSNTNAELYGGGAAGASSGGSAGSGVPDAVSGTGGAAGAAGAAGATDAGDGDAADADGPCALVQHFNGYNTFVDCHAVGDYNDALALNACASYFGVNCQVLTNPGLCGGANMVGYMSQAWIAWTWTADSGTTRESWTASPECPTSSDAVWW